MKISRSNHGSVVVLKPHVQMIDASVAVNFKSQLLEMVEKGSKNFVINLSEVNFIDSSGLGALVSVLKKIGPEGTIKFCEVKTGIRSILELTQLDKVFNIHLSEKEAVFSFNS